MSAIIRVALSRKALQIEPGQQGELSATIQNLSEIVDQYVVEVEGLDAGWLTLLPPRISLFPQDQGLITIKLHPPENALAGTYDLAVRVASRENPIEWTKVQATLDVTPVLLFEVSLSPQRKSIVEEEAGYDVLLTNPGNVDLTLSLSASDPEEGCAYRFDRSLVTVEAGGSAPVELTVTPKHPAREQGKLYNFTVKAAPVDAPQRACSVLGQLQCEPQVVALDLGLWPQRRSAVGAGKFQVQLSNRGNTDLMLALEGTDPDEACAFKFESRGVTLRAGESRQVDLTVAPIGRPETDRPRVYDFMVRAVPKNAPYKVVQADGQLECLPVVISFDAEIVPAQRTVRREGEFDVQLINRCEAGLSLELTGTDEAGACDFRFETPRVTLRPQERKMVPLRVKVRKTPSPGEARSHAFSVKATPADAPHLAKKATARIEAVRRRGMGTLVWSTLGFGLGHGIMWLLLWESGVDIEGALFLLLGVMGAAGGLSLGVGVRRRILIAAAAGALGFGSGAFLEIGYGGLTAFVVWGALAGGLLGLGLEYRWRAILMAVAGALAGPAWGILAEMGLGALAGVPVGLILGLPVLLLERGRDGR
jgi:uncharacterized membrane protein